MTASLVRFVLIALIAVACERQSSDRTSVIKDAEIHLRSVISSSDCADCKTITLIDRLGRSQLMISNAIILSIPISRVNVMAVGVNQGAKGVEWKAQVQLADEACETARELASSTPEAEYLLVSVGERALSVVASSILSCSILVGAFDSKLELERALSIGELREHRLEVEIAPNVESLEAIRAADEAL